LYVAGALEGIRILDCTQIIAGPLAGSLLTEMGADVIKIEPPEGEPWRLQAEIIPKESRGYMHVNRGKRGITLDLKQEGSRPVREALIRWADVLLTNYRPGVPEELGVDYETARAIKPNIIFCESTAFGKSGPDAYRRGYDIVAQAMSGVTTSNPNLTDGLPMQIAFAPSDVVSGVAMAWAITAALYHREKTGEGQAINASLLLTGLFLQAGAKEIVALDTEPRALRNGLLKAARVRGASIEEVYAERRALMPELSGNIYYRPYQTKDSYIVVGCLGPAPRARFREALDIRDPRYEEGFDRTTLRAVGLALTAECEAALRGKTNEEWLAIFDGFGIAAGPVRFVDELWDDPQVEANSYVVEYDHTLLGPLRGNAPVVSMSATPTRVQRASPALGEHTEEVLTELGFTADEVSGFRAQGVIV
jgi:formyl-CoA transferase